MLGAGLGRARTEGVKEARIVGCYALSLRLLGAPLQLDRVAEPGVSPSAILIVGLDVGVVRIALLGLRHTEGEVDVVGEVAGGVGLEAAEVLVDEGRDAVG